MKKRMTQVFVALFMFVPMFAFAQTPQTPQTQSTSEAIILSTVNINGAKIISQEGNKVKISFDITNREKVQPDVVYSVELIAGEDVYGEIVDAKVYEEKLNLAENSSVHKEIVYQAPLWLSGKYALWVGSGNVNSLSFGAAMAGTVEFARTEEYVEIEKKSCYLNVEGDEKKVKYTLSQGVDITQAENLVGYCKIKNHFSEAISLIPRFETRYRSLYGQTVGTEKQTAFSLGSQEEKEISFILPKAQKPQAYDALLSFLDGKGKTVSNSVAFHYVLAGEGATIQNVRFDKNNYVEGDTAEVVVDYSLSADGFIGSRTGGTKMDKVNLEMTITGADGAACSNPVSKTADNDGRGMENLDLKIPIIRNCADPELQLAITNTEGVTLAENFKVEMASQPQDSEAEKNSMLYVAVVLIVILTILSFLFIWVKKRNLGGKAFLLMFTVLGLGFLASGDVLAYDFTAPGGCDEPNADACLQHLLPPDQCHCWSPATYYVDVQGADVNGWPTGTNVVDPGQLLWVGETKKAVLGNCTNGDFALDLFAGNAANGEPEVQIRHVYCRDGDDAGSDINFDTECTNSMTNQPWPHFRAPIVPGEYQIKFVGVNPYGGRTEFPLTYYVRGAGACGTANGQSFVYAPIENLCSTVWGNSTLTGTGPWYWQCYGYAGGSWSPLCSANKTCVPDNGVCGPANGRSFPTKPTTGLCNSTWGNSNVTGIGTWSWSCYGSNNGCSFPASCSATCLPNCPIYDCTARLNGCGGTCPYKTPDCGSATSYCSGESFKDPNCNTTCSGSKNCSWREVTQ